MMKSSNQLNLSMAYDRNGNQASLVVDEPLLNCSSQLPLLRHERVEKIHNFASFQLRLSVDFSPLFSYSAHVQLLFIFVSTNNVK